ncbi:MAG TPA: hypothetical protein VGF40_07030, partial [Thermoanaerobaculia bacterium]
MLLPGRMGRTALGFLAGIAVGALVMSYLQERSGGAAPAAARNVQRSVEAPLSPEPVGVPTPAESEIEPPVATPARAAAAAPAPAVTPDALAIPVAGVAPSALRDHFDDPR